MQIPSLARTSLLFLLLGMALASDVSGLELTPEGDLSLSLPFGGKAIQTLEIANADPDLARSWQLVFEDEPADPLDRLVQVLETSSDPILSLLPDRYFFTNGDNGSQIGNGGGSMYSSGNRIELDGTRLDYSDRLPTSAAVGDWTARYVTAKLDGLFVFSAQLEGVSQFAISGRLGNNGTARVMVGEFALDVGGTQWRAFIKRVLYPGTPSVQHLLLVPDSPGLMRRYSDDSRSDEHMVSGLPISTRFHYLLYSRDQGQDYDLSVSRELAKTYLESLLPGPPWCLAVPAAGTTAAGGSSPLELQIDASTLPAGTHSTRFTVLPSGVEPDSIPADAWRSLTVDVAAAEFVPGAEAIGLVSLAGFQPEASELQITSSDGSELPGLVVESSEPWLRVTPLDGGVWRLEADTTGLPAAIYRLQLTVRNGQSTQTIPLSLSVESPRYSLLRADPARPRLYALSRVAEGQGFVVVYDTATQAAIHAIPVGREPTDFDLNEDASEMLVLNNSDASISRIDLDTMLVTETVPLQEFTVSPDPYDGRIADGPGSIVYYIDEANAPRLRVFDIDSRTVLQNLAADLSPPDDPEDSFGFGDIVVSPDRSRIYGWSRNGWSGDPQDSHVLRFSVAGDGILSNFVRSKPRNRPGFRRDPEETPALLSADGRELFIKDSWIDTEDLDRELIRFPDRIYSISPGGEMVGLRQRILRLDDQSAIDVPGQQPNAFTPDYAWFTSVGAEGELVWTDLTNLVTPDELGLGFEPSDGEGTLLPGSLRWPPIAGVRRYEIYLGTDGAAVASATPGSPEFLGAVSGTEFALPADLAPGVDFYWRVQPLAGSDPQFDLLRSFSVLPLTSSPQSIRTVTVSGASRRREPLAIETATSTVWSVATDAAWLASEPASGTGSGEVSLLIDASELQPGNYRAEVILSVGETRASVLLDVMVAPLNFIAVAADPDRPLIWAISQSTDQTGFLLTYNTATDELESAIPTGLDVWDLTVHPRDDRVYVAQRDPAVIHGFERDSLEHVSTIDLGSYSEETASFPGLRDLSAGPAGRLVVEVLESQRSALILIDTSSGAVLQDFSLGDIPAGGGASSPDGRTYYHGDANYSLAGLTKYDLDGDELTELRKITFAGESESGSATVLVSADGTRVGWNGGILDADLALLDVIPARLLALSQGGEFVSDRLALYNVGNGLPIGDLPVRTVRQAFDTAGKKLYLFGAEVEALELAEFAAIPDLDLVATPPDGTTVLGTDVSLSWEPAPTALTYSVYFGTDRDGVELAGPGTGSGSAAFLGTVTGTSWEGELPGVVLGGRYFWRVDINGIDGSRPGTVWEFSVADLAPVPRHVVVSASQGAAIAPQVVLLESAGVQTWGAVTETPWIQLEVASGDSDDELRFQIDPAGLAIGTHAGSIAITSASETIHLPVELDLFELDIQHFAPDPGRPLIYGINKPSAAGTWSHVLAINAATAEVLDSIRVGRDVTDLVIDPSTDRLIATNHGHPETRVIDLASFRELEPLDLGTDVYTIEIDPGGRTLVTESRSSTVQIRIFDLDTLELRAAFSGRAGDGKLDPQRQVYYRAENSSNSDLLQYDLTSNPPALISKVEHGYSIDRFLLAVDGSSLVWNNSVYSPELQLTNVLLENPVCLSPGGELAIGASSIYWLDDGTLVKDLPFAASQSSFSADGDYLILFDQQGRSLESLPIASITELPGPTPRDGKIFAESPPELRWTAVDGATSYSLTLSSPLLGELSFENLPDSNFTLPVEFAPGEFVSWSASAEIPGGDPVVTPSYRFGIGFQLRSTIEGSRFDTVQLGPQHLLSNAGNQYELRSFDPATGQAELLERNQVGIGNGASSGSPRSRLDRGRGFIAVPGLEVNSVEVGAAFSFDAASYARALTTPVPLPSGSNRLFGGDLAASGGLLLAGGHRSSDNRYQVAAYLTHPEIVQTQLIAPLDSAAHDGFGAGIALHGNTAAITANRPNDSAAIPNPAVYIFERDPSTGLWSEQQKLRLPNTSPNGLGGHSIQLAERFLVVGIWNLDQVYIFQRGQDGLWSHQITLDGADQRGASERFGESLAVVGSRLFVGDPEARVDPQEGAVFSFIFDGSDWQLGTPLVPPDPSVRRKSFGLSLSGRDGWLVVGAGIASSGAFTGTTGHVFEIDPDANHTPLLPPAPVTQVVIGRPFELPVAASDLDGQAGLVIEALSLPDWISIADQGDGVAILSGTPPSGRPGSLDVQLRVTDPQGASCDEAFRIERLDPSDAPVLSARPGDLIFQEGQDLLLRAAASGARPLTWQWFHDDVAIPGANWPSLAIAEAEFNDAGRYRVEVSNAAGVAVSTTATVTLDPAGRSAGSWAGFGNTMRRAGLYPALLKRHTFIPAWSTRLQAGAPLTRAAIADGLVGLGGLGNQSSQVFALDLVTGELRWSRTFDDTHRANPITIHGGGFYYQETRRERSASQLWALSAADGSVRWQRGWDTQFEGYESPAVTDLGVWIGGGGGDGLYGFSPTGSPLFFAELPQESDRWTPIISGDRLFTWVGGGLREHDPKTGALLWSIPSRGRGQENYYSGVIRGDRSFVVTDQDLLAIDLAAQKPLWTQAGAFSSNPAVADELVYVILGHQVLSFHTEDGAPGPVFSIPAGIRIESNQPLLLNDFLIVSTTGQTFIFDRSTIELHQVIDSGGELSFADGYLIIAGRDGVASAWFANGAPEFSDQLPTGIDAGAMAGPASLSLGNFATDPDPGDSVAWMIVYVSRPEIFRSLEIDPETGDITVVYNPWESGPSDVTVAGADPVGNVTETTITFSVPPHPLPAVLAAGDPVLNRQTGLYEQTVTVTNLAAREIAGFDLQVSGLADGVQLNNATSSDDDGWSVSLRQPLAAGASIALVLEYFAPVRGTVLVSTPTVSLVAGPESDPDAERSGLAIDRCEMLEDGLLIEFSSNAGSLYELQYSDDNSHWKVSPTRIRAASNRTQWIDRGPPRTDTPPANKSSRFYRVREILRSSAE